MNELLQHYLQLFVIRNDCIVKYDASGGNKTKYTTPKQHYMSLKSCSLGQDWKNIKSAVGIHCIGQPGTPFKNKCKWICKDIDNHAGLSANANADYVQDYLYALMDLGLNSLIDANGVGGYKVWSFFKSPIPSNDAYDLINYLDRQVEKYPDMEATECFPKQRETNHCGSNLRLPSIHPKHNIWSSISLDGKRYYAVNSNKGLDLLAQCPQNNLIEFERPIKREYVSNSSNCDDVWSYYNKIASWSDLMDSAGWEYVGKKEDVCYWRHPTATHNISATTNADDGKEDKLYVFSSNCSLEQDKYYTKSWFLKDVIYKGNGRDAYEYVISFNRKSICE